MEKLILNKFISNTEGHKKMYECVFFNYNNIILNYKGRIFIYDDYDIFMMFVKTNKYIIEYIDF